MWRWNCLPFRSTMIHLRFLVWFVSLTHSLTQSEYETINSQYEFLNFNVSLIYDKYYTGVFQNSCDITGILLKVALNTITLTEPTSTINV
jgi:hypothetical protein